MKKLFLLRHAQTLPAEGGSDIDRKLTPNGQADGKALGETMKHKGYTPDFIYCSPARRTKETMECLLESLDQTPTESPNILYDGTQGDLFHLIQNTSDETKNLLMIAHNPSIHALAALLASENETALMNRLATGYTPGALSVFECECESWQEIQPGINTLLDFLEPLDYNAPSTPARWT